MLQGCDLILQAGDIGVPAGIPIVPGGHSRKPSRTERNGVLYLNPGSTGPRRFKLPIAIARRGLTGTPWNVEFVELTSVRE